MEIRSDYRLPAEFEPHKSTWLLWPSRPDNWRVNAYFGQQDIAALASLIAQFEPVRLGVNPLLEGEVRARIPSSITVVPLQFNDIWVRDTGPITLLSSKGSAIAVHFKFNSWGGLFSESSEDNRVASAIASYEHIQTLQAPIVLEGGAITCNGANTIIATEESILAANRNPGLRCAEANRIFKQFLNIDKVIWLPYGLNNDEAGGHVDNICAFASEDVVLLAWTQDTNHPSYERVRLAKKVLTRSTNARGQDLYILEVPLPEPTVISVHEAEGFASPAGTIARTAGTPLAASSINFYVTERAVFVPTFNSTADESAISVISKAFSGRKIFPFHSREFLLGGGAIHCITKEIPVSKEQITWPEK